MRVFPGGVEDASTTGEGLSVRELLDAAWEETLLARAHDAQSARLTALAARLAEEQEQRSGWGVIQEHALRNAMTGEQGERAARAGAAGLDDPIVRDAQDRGELSVESTDAVMAAARRSDDPRARSQVVVFGVRLAKDHPVGKVRAGAERLVSTLDPAALRKGHAQEAERRNVRLVPMPFGMARMTASGPAVELRTVTDGVDAAAWRTAEFDKQAEAPRTQAQRGFDVFRAIWKPVGSPEERAKSINQLMARPHMLVHVPAETLAGESDQPGWLSDDTPIPADVVREIAKDATWQALVEDSGRVVGLGDRVLAPGSVAGPGGRIVGLGERAPAPVFGSAGPMLAPGPVAGADGGVIGLGDGAPTAGPGGMAAGPAGTAPVPPRVLPDPADRPANTTANNSYTAGPKLRLLLEARDRGRVAPNCSAPPGRREADHRIPFDPSKPAVDQTTGANTQLLCKREHQLKTHHGWAHEHDIGTGQTTITPPHSPPVTTVPRE
jgi:hypothetical protein